jgi:triosephosphate isomerase
VRKPLVAANWKMHGDRARVAAFLASFALRDAAADAAIAGDRSRIETVFLPPVCYLTAAAAPAAAAGFALGAQDVHWLASGACTGAISAPMLTDCGCTFVLVGHSERRQAGDADEHVAAKCLAAQGAGVTPVLCVGETLAERDAGSAEAVVERQLRSALTAAMPDRLCIAYEPVWAIGTGRTATPAQAQAMHAVIRAWLEARFGAAGRDIRVLYGGSVTPENAAALAAERDIDGALVGGASLDAGALQKIIAAVAHSAGGPT